MAENNSFNHLVEWATSKGLVLNKKIENRSVNGLGGMYATESIAEGELLASMPPHDFFAGGRTLPESASRSAGHIHSICREWQKGNASALKHMFSKFYTHDELEAVSTYFCTPDEIATLHRASSTLGYAVNNANVRHKALIDGLFAFDRSISYELYTVATLNYAARAMGNIGIVPVLDNFNHCDWSGREIAITDTSITLVSGKDYASGDQLFINYGSMDVSKHAIHYNYFDPNANHRISINRLTFPKNDALMRKAQEMDFNVSMRASPAQNGFYLDHPDAYISIDGPSSKLVSFLELFSQNKGGFFHVYGSIIEHLDQSNKVETMGKKLFKGRLNRFYSMLRAEKHIYYVNKRWIERYNKTVTLG